MIKLPFISESYRFAFLGIINGNFDMDKVTVFSKESKGFCWKVIVLMKVTVYVG